MGFYSTDNLKGGRSAASFGAKCSDGIGYASRGVEEYKKLEEEQERLKKECSFNIRTPSNFDYLPVFWLIELFLLLFVIFLMVKFAKITFRTFSALG